MIGWSVGSKYLEFGKAQVDQVETCHCNWCLKVRKQMIFATSMWNTCIPMEHLQAKRMSISSHKERISTFFFVWIRVSISLITPQITQKSPVKSHYKTTSLGGGCRFNVSTPPGTQHHQLRPRRWDRDEETQHHHSSNDATSHEKRCEVLGGDKLPWAQDCPDF